MYLTMFGSPAIASIIASVKFVGYAYMSRIQPPPNSFADARRAREQTDEPLPVAVP